MTNLQIEKFRRETKGCLAIQSWWNLPTFGKVRFIEMFCIDFANDNFIGVPIAEEL